MGNKATSEKMKNGAGGVGGHYHHGLVSPIKETQVMTNGRKNTIAMPRPPMPSEVIINLKNI